MREDFYYFVSTVTLQIPRYAAGGRRFFPLPMSFWRSTPSSLTAPSRFSARKPSVTCWSTYGPAICLNFKPQSRHLSLSETRQFLSRPSMRRRNRAGRMENRRPLLLKEATRASSIQLERQLISEVLISTGGNRKRAAADLGISYKALLYKLKQIETENQSAFCGNGVAL